MTNLRFDKIKAYLDRIPKEMEGIEAKVGFFPSAIYPDGTPVAEVAAVQEFGDPAQNIPQRPFFRPTIEKRKSEWVRQLAQGTKRVLDGAMSGRGVFEAIAIGAAGDIQKSITEVHEPALAQSTIKARMDKWYGKGKWGKEDITPTSIKPLVDTGLMIASVQGVVGDKE